MALLARGGCSQRLSVDHRADNAAELMRVLSAGGEVDYDRYGTLRVYRPNDMARTNGAMFTRWARWIQDSSGMCVLSGIWAVCFGCVESLLMRCVAGLSGAACSLGMTRVLVVLQVPG